MKHFISSLHNQKGFVILFTVLIVMIIFTMGLGIYSIAIRQTVLSSTAREAGQAFYAADAGVECALKAQTKGVFSGTVPVPVECGNETIMIDPAITTPSIFNVSVTPGGNASCATVTVITLPQDSQRRIISQGFNACALGKPQYQNPRLVERDLDVTYGIANPN